MPSSDLIIYYWDACVPLSYVNGVLDRLPHIDAFMSKSGTDFQIITSVLSITEVAFATYEKDASTLDPDAESKISKLWQAGSPIKIVEFYELIAIKAQRLMRSAITNKWSLKPADAIHLATADQLKAKEFHTYDERLDKFWVLTDNRFPIHRPISATPHLLLLPAVADSPPVQEIKETPVAAPAAMPAPTVQNVPAVDTPNVNDPSTISASSTKPAEPLKQQPSTQNTTSPSQPNETSVESNPSNPEGSS